LADLLDKYLGRACLGDYGRVNFRGIRGDEILFPRGPWKMKYYRREAFRHANLPCGIGKLLALGLKFWGRVHAFFNDWKVLISLGVIPRRVRR